MRITCLPALVLSLLLSTLAGCAPETFEEANAEYFEGHAFDEGLTEAPPGFEKADRAAPYDVPDDLPTLVRPEVIISLENRSVHLFDRVTGFSAVYPTGVGVLGNDGTSITPTGHFRTHADTNQGWYYVASRWEPAYFEGYPFLRLDAENSRGYHTYGLHGPITNPLRRGYVSHGCARMAKDDIVELFFLVRSHPSTPVTIQQEVELDANGEPVDVGGSAALFAPGELIPYGESVGPRELGFVGDPCVTDIHCGNFSGAGAYFCHSAGFCTLDCSGPCPDRDGHATTFCIEDPSLAGAGICASHASELNGECATMPGTVAGEHDRWVGSSGARPGQAEVCAPIPPTSG